MIQSRRNFIGRLTASTIALSGISKAAPLHGEDRFFSEGKKLNVAIMGLGSYGTRVADAMQTCSLAKLTGVISGSPEKIKIWQKKYGIPERNCYNYQNFDQIKNNPDIDAVYVITPNGLHKEHTIRVAAAGKHVICEKPMAINAAESEEMIEACKRHGVQLLIGYRMHFEPKTLEVVRMRTEGVFGKIVFFQGLSGFRIGDPSQWRLNPTLSGGGAMMDIGIYSINGARYMLGEEPVWVSAQETKTDHVKFKPGIDETITFQIGFPSGVIASCLSTYSSDYLDKFFLTGEKGFAEMQPSTGYGPIQGRTHKGELNYPHVTHQKVQMDEMAEIILNGKKPVIPVDGNEGLKDMVIIDAIYRAVLSGNKERIDLK
jgi:predicted dehydrogenase